MCIIKDENKKQKDCTATVIENRPVSVLEEEILCDWLLCEGAEAGMFGSRNGSTCSLKVFCSSVKPATHCVLL